jgi:hypothetical protein
MLGEISNDPLLNLEKCTFSELLTILQNYANVHFVDVHQTWFGSYIFDCVLKEKIVRYNREGMVPTKFGDVWEPKNTSCNRKSCISCNLCELLNMGPIEKCNIDLYFFYKA